MIAMVHKRVPADRKRRQQEITQQLAELGLVRRPHRLGLDPTVLQAPRSRRLRIALERLGPVFSWFGLYLSSRVDLLPVPDCFELSAIPDQAPVTPMPTIRETIRRELGYTPEEVSLTIEPEPFESRLVVQSHHAWLGPDESVTVKVVHPELEEQLQSDAPLLPLLEEALTGGEWAGWAVAQAITDFQRAARALMDMRAEAEALQLLAQDAQEFDLLRVPNVHRHLCSSQVLTVERVSGVSLEHVIRSLDQPGLDVDPRNVASHLCLVWLRQALLGRQFPVEPRPENIIVLPNHQLALTAGPFAGLPAEAKTNLLEYLIAVATQNPDQACASLLEEMLTDKGRMAVAQLQPRFRQAVPFREGGWSPQGENDTLAEHLFVQWQLASAGGARPQSHLLSFYRGLFLTATTARQLAPEHDPLLEGLENLRFQIVVKQFRDMMGLRQAGQSLDRYAALMMEFPKKLDEALTVAAEGQVRVKLQVSEQRLQQRRQKNSSAVVITLLLMLMTVALWSHHLAAVAGVWTDRISAVVFVALGALLLRAVARSR